MTGSEQMLFTFIGGNAHFDIPVYQRSYDWRIEHCNRLYQDLVSVAKNKEKIHFLGSIVSVNNPDQGMQHFLIIDGQQRLTTVSLLLLAMHHSLEKGIVHSEDENLSARLLKNYLIDEFEKPDKKILLRLNREDQKAYAALFESDAELVEDSNITINYRHFCELIQKQEISVDALYSAICQLQIINIRLKHGEDDPQLIFESLNSTGLALSEGDKIRNYILMGLNPNDQAAYYDKYWNVIEENSGQNVGAFVRDYLSLKQQSIPTLRTIYPRFKAFWQEAERSGQSTEEMLKDMRAYSKRYNSLIAPDVSSVKATEIDWCLYRLNRLRVTVARPFLLRVLELRDTGVLDDQEVLRILRQIETYVFRRMICDLPSQGLNKIFLSLHWEIIGLDPATATDDYCDKFTYILNGKSGSGRFPSDEEFRRALSQKAVYSMHSDSKKYILERLENGNLKDGAIGVWNKLDNGSLSIEHIMPQTLTRNWIEDLGEDYRRVHDEWLHRLANLTLTGYNTEFGNSRFAEKKNMVGGYARGGLHLNAWIGKQEKWTETELEQRDAWLQDEAVRLWQRPKTKYMPPVHELERVALDDDETLTGKQLSRFIFHGVEKPSSSWTDMYQQVLKQLHEHDKSILTHLARSQNPNEDMSGHFFISPPSHHHARIDDNLYVLTHNSTRAKVNMLRKLFPLFEENPGELIFCLGENDTTSAKLNDEAESIREYWHQAMPTIRDATGVFKQCGNTKTPYISSFTSVQGMYARCLIRANWISVQIYINTDDKQGNKKMYDALYSHKDEIEAAVGDSLEWKGAGRNGACTVSLALPDVTVNNKEDWPQMTQFHSEKMAKLLEAATSHL